MQEVEQLDLSNFQTEIDADTLLEIDNLDEDSLINSIQNI